MLPQLHQRDEQDDASRGNAESPYRSQGGATGVDAFDDIHRRHMCAKLRCRLTGVGPEFSSQLIMLKESFRKVIICRHEPGYFFRNLLPDGCVAFSPFPTARGRRASPSALRVPGGAAASAYFIE